MPASLKQSTRIFERYWFEDNDEFEDEPKSIANP
jgi:hypothetical protein